MENKVDLKIKILLEEYNRLHQDRRNWDNNIFQLFVLIITMTALGVTAVLQYRLESIEVNNSNGNYDFWSLFLIAYPYITYLFTLVFLILSGAIAHNSATLINIENRINSIAKDKVLFWENVIVSKTHYRTFSTYFLASISLFVFFVVVDIYCINIGLKIFEDTTYKSGYIILNAICILFILVLLTYHFTIERTKIINRINNYLK